ncbi:LOW QUALITY PROTEIN: 60S ribosomal protein L6, partial [Galemys pyrenaicus]
IVRDKSEKQATEEKKPETKKVDVGGKFKKDKAKTSKKGKPHCRQTPSEDWADNPNLLHILEKPRTTVTIQQLNPGLQSKFLAIVTKPVGSNKNDSTNKFEDRMDSTECWTRQQQRQQYWKVMPPDDQQLSKGDPDTECQLPINSTGQPWPGSSPISLFGLLINQFIDQSAQSSKLMGAFHDSGTKSMGLSTAGTMPINLTGQHRGKRIVFLIQLSSGFLLVTDPGMAFPLCTTKFVIGNSTKIGISVVNIPKHLSDAYFKKKLHKL